MASIPNFAFPRRRYCCRRAAVLSGGWAWRLEAGRLISQGERHPSVLDEEANEVPSRCMPEDIKHGNAALRVDHGAKGSTVVGRVGL